MTEKSSATSSPDTATLKSRRAAAKTTPGTLPPDADVGPEVGRDEPARRFPLLGDPREPLVLGGSGMTLGGEHGGKYVRAEVAGIESITPPGCTTPVARRRWSVGQFVLRSVYEEYVADRSAGQTRAQGDAAAKEKNAESVNP